MTISIAWIRKFEKQEELIFASDSRLRLNGKWDGVQKIFLFKRSDCAISFSGDTYYAFPLIFQIQNYVNYQHSKIDYLDISILQDNIYKFINSMISEKEKSEVEDEGCKFLFGGFSYKAKDFIVWKFEYNYKKNAFDRNRIDLTGARLGFIGDYEENYREILDKKLRPIGSKAKKRKFNFEPLEALNEICAEKDKITVGGNQQVLKVFNHMNRIPCIIKNKKGKNTLLGREIFEKEEKLLYPTL